MTDTRPGPSLTEIETAAADLQGRTIATPTVRLNSDRLTSLLPTGVDAVMKLELFQQAGSFKTLGATVVLTDDIHAAFTELDRMLRDEGRVRSMPLKARCW